MNRRQLLLGAASATALASSVLTPALARPSPEGAKGVRYPPGTVTGSKVALVAGIQRYKEKSNFQRLQLAEADARAMAAKLGECGYSLVGGKVWVDCTRDELSVAIGLFGAALQEADEGALFISAHGFRDELTGENYIVPITDVPIYDGQFSLVFPVKEIYSVIDAARPQAGGGSLSEGPPVVVLLDCCRNRPDGKGGGSDEGGLATISGKVSRNTTVGFATEPGARAFEIANDKAVNSPYTAALLKYLFAPGVSVSDALSQARREVIRTTTGRQRPANVNYLEQPVVLVPLSPGESRGADPDAILGVVTVLLDPDGPVLLGCVPEVDDEGGRPCGWDDGVIHATVAPYRMMRTEVTQALWERLAGKSVGLLSVTERISDRDYIGADLPMVNISWLDSVLFANASTDLCNGAGSSLRKAYRFIRDERGEVVKVEQVPGADGWRLPTEDEWEVAARLSSGQYRTPFAGGMDSMEELITGANTAQEDEWPNLAPADSGNQGGFCHLTGNVKEWCWDRYDRSRGGRGETQADLQQKHSRVARGGSAHLHPAVAGVSVRSSIPVSARGSALGVRLVRSVS